VPIFVLQGQDDYDDAYKDLAQFAKMGVILGISKKYWDQTLKRKGKGAKLARREMFRPITSHNDKLGVDYDLKGKRYVAQYPAGKQFNVSQYKRFLVDAARVNSGFWKLYLEYLSQQFTAEPTKLEADYDAIKPPRNTNSFALGMVPQEDYDELVRGYQRQNEAYNQ